MGGYHYPTDDDIQFFYFTLFKKNGFIFLIFCYIIYRNCFLEFLLLFIKSGISFYLIIYFIYIVVFIKKKIDSVVYFIFFFFFFSLNIHLLLVLYINSLDRNSSVEE